MVQAIAGEGCPEGSVQWTAGAFYYDYKSEFAYVGLGTPGLIGPKFPLPCVVPGSAYVLLPVAAVLVGVVASGFGLRRAVTIDPALAFGSA